MAASHWTTTAVQALPLGWVNHHRTRRTPCPAVLLQERGVVGHMRSPYETRVAFAAATAGTLVAACDLPDYIETVYTKEDI